MDRTSPRAGITAATPQPIGMDGGLANPAGPGLGDPAALDLIHDKAFEDGENLFLGGLCCAESVLKAIADLHSLKDPNIPKIATGFCGGVSRTSGMCGALAGGIMALGLLSGRSGPAEPKDQCYALVHCLVHRFREVFGSTQCTDLLGCDISTAEGAGVFASGDLEISVCARVTRVTSGLVEAIYGQRESIRHPLL